MRKGRRFKNVQVVKLNERSSFKFLLIFKQAYGFPIEIGIAERSILAQVLVELIAKRACSVSYCQMSTESYIGMTYLYGNIRNRMRSHQCQAA